MFISTNANRKTANQFDATEKAELTQKSELFKHVFTSESHDQPLYDAFYQFINVIFKKTFIEQNYEAKKNFLKEMYDR